MTVDPTVLAERAAAGAFDDDVLAWIAAGMQAFQRAEGAVPLERCLRLPKGDEEDRLANRDRALRRAALLLPQPTPRATFLKLESEWKRFVAGRWQEWRNEGNPPAWASPLQRELFYASRHHRSTATGSLGVRQLHRIIVDGEVDSA